MGTGIISLGSRGELSKLILNGALQKMKMDFEYDEMDYTVLFETYEEYESWPEINGLLIEDGHVERLINGEKEGDYTQLLRYLKYNLDKTHRDHELIWIILDTSKSREKALYYFVLAALKLISPNIKTGVIAEFADPSEGIDRVKGSVEWFSEYLTKLEAISPLIPWNRGTRGSASQVFNLIRTLDLLLNYKKITGEIEKSFRRSLATVGIWSIAEKVESGWVDINRDCSGLSDEVENLEPLTLSYQFDETRDIYRLKTPNWQVAWSISDEVPNKQFELQDALY